MDNIQDKVVEDLKKAGIDIDPSTETEGTSKEANIAPEYTPFEQEQMLKGWKPGGRKTAEEWAEGEPIIEELRSLRKESKKQQDTIAQLKKFLDSQEQAGYQRALQEIAQQRDHAIRNGNVEQVNYLDEQKADVMKAAANNTVIEPQEEQTPEAITAFYTRNDKWLKGESVTEVQMMKYAWDTDAILAKKNLSIDKRMQLLEDCVKNQFPDYFNNGSNIIYPETKSVEAPQNIKQDNKKKFTRAHLNNSQKEVLTNFEKYKIMTEAEFIQGLVASGELR